MDKNLINDLIAEVNKLHQRYELSKTTGPDYYEPGMMEFLDQSEGIYHEDTGEILLRFEARGTRYDGRTEVIEKMKVLDPLQVVRDPQNIYNHNNFTIMNGKDENVGNMPAELCNVIAPLYDLGVLKFVKSFASYVEPVTVRSRHAKQAVLFVELRMQLSE